METKKVLFTLVLFVFLLQSQTATLGVYSSLEEVPYKPEKKKNDFKPWKQPVRAQDASYTSLSSAELTMFGMGVFFLSIGLYILYNEFVVSKTARKKFSVLNIENADNKILI